MNSLAGDLLFKVIFEYETIFGFLDTFKTTSAVVSEGSQQITSAIEEVNKSFEGFSGLMKNLPGLNIVFDTFVSALGSLSESTQNIQKTNRQLQALTSSEEEMAEVQQYLLETANKHSVAVEDVSLSYINLFKLQKDGKLWANETKALYEGLIGFANRTGADSKAVGKALKELYDAMSEGSVSALTLRKVTDPLPGLFGELEKASGMGAEAFKNLTDKGKLTSETFAKTMVFALQKYQTASQSFQDDTKKGMNDLEPALNRLNNQFSLLKAELAAPFTEAMTPLIDFMMTKIDEAVEYIHSNGPKLAATAANIHAAVKPLINATIIIIGKLSEMFVAILPYITWFAEVIAGLIKWVADFVVENTSLVLSLYAIYKAVQMLIWVLGILGKIKLAILIMEFIGLQRVMIIARAAMIALASTPIVVFFTGIIASITGAIAAAGGLTAALGYLAYQMYTIAMTPLGMALIAVSAGLYAVYAWASSSRSELEQVAEATRKNIELLAKFRDATQELEKFKVGADVIAEINHIRAAVMVGRIAEEEGLKAVRTLVNAVRDAEAKRAADVQKLESDIANKRMQLNQKLEELQEKQREEEKRIEEAKAAEAEKSLQTILDGRKRFDSAVLESAKLTNQKIVELEKAAADKIKDLQDQLAMEKMSLSDKIRELRRKEMSDFDAQADLEAQIGEKMLVARKALEEGDSQKSRALGEEIESLVGNIEDVDKAVSLLEQVSGLTQDAIQSNINEVQKFSSELAKTDGVKSAEEIKVQADVEGALKEIDTLEQELAGLKDKEIRIDVVRVMSNIETEKQRAQAEAEAAARAQAAGGDTEAVAEAMQSAAADTSTAADSQKEAADSLKEAADSLKESATPTQAFATGGSVPGVGDTDTVPAMLTPGEFVVTKPRVERYQGLFDFLNFAPLQAVDKFIATRMNLGGLVQSMPTLHLNEGGVVPALAPAMAAPANVETIRFEWTIGQRAGVVNTLRSERQNLQAFMNAINETGRGL